MGVHVLHNPTTPRKARSRADAIIQRLRADGHRVQVLSRPTPQEATTALRLAVDAGEVERLVIAGGDGLVHLAIQHIATSDIPVTIAPVGTGNDFATAIDEHITSTADDTGATELSSDLIKITKPDGSIQWAASVAIAGFPADINSRANKMSRRWGSNVYSVAAALELPNFKPRSISLSIDSEPIRTNTAMLAIGNTKYFGGGMLPCPDALPDDGLLHLTSIERTDRRGLFVHLRGREGGTADRDEVRRSKGERIEVETSDEEFWADGEPIGAGPLTFQIVPKALRIERVDNTSN